MIVRFTIEAHAPFTSGRQGIRTLIPTSENRLSRAARPTVSGYLPFQWTHRESNPDSQTASLMSSRWTMSPSFSVDQPGSRTPISWLQARRLPVGRAAHLFLERESFVAIDADFNPSVVPLDQQPIGPSGDRTRPSALPRRRAAQIHLQTNLQK